MDHTTHEQGGRDDHVEAAVLDHVNGDAAEAHLQNKGRASRLSGRRDETHKDASSWLFRRHVVLICKENIGQHTGAGAPFCI